MSTQCQQEFERNSGWLKFGVHAADDSLRYGNCEEHQAGQDYAHVVAALRRIVDRRRWTKLDYTATLDPEKVWQKW